MKIGIFGCSHVAGLDKRYHSESYNLATAIADKCPQHKVYDYSMGGHSMQMINYLFQEFKHKHDFNIVKITSPGRLTFFSEFDFENNRAWATSNLNTWKSPSDYGRHVVRMNYTSVPESVSSQYNLKTIKQLHKEYYRHINLDMSIAETIAITSYFQTHADYVYAHRNYYGHDLSNEMVLTEQILPNYKSYLIDEGGHLNKEGTCLEADWIVNNVLKDTL